MTLTPQQAPISGARRVARIAVAAGLVAALSAAGPIPMAFSAAADDAPAASDPGLKSADEKLGSTTPTHSPRPRPTAPRTSR